MTSPQQSLDAFDLVANALKCPRGNLNPESAMYRDHGWDSFGHIQIVLALEERFGMSMTDEQVQQSRTMQGILTLWASFLDKPASNGS
jgi:acyl carrier protein